MHVRSNPDDHTTFDADALPQVISGPRSRPRPGQARQPTRPALPWIATGLLIGGFACLVGGVLLIAIPLRRMS
jgi:hypothetical protein